VCVDTILSGIPLFRVMSKDSVRFSRHKFSESLPAVRTIVPSRPDDMPYRPDQSDQASSVQKTCIFRPDLYCIEKLLFQPISASAARPDASQWSINFKFFPSKFRIREDWYTRPDDVVSRMDAFIYKARIAIQISPSGRQSALVRMLVQLIWKLSIRLQPSGRLPFMVRTRS
jgi:hypothetical protein